MLSYTVQTKGKIFDPRIADKIISKAVQDTSGWALNKVKERSPIRTGRLRAGWTARPSLRELFITNSVPYSGIVSKRVNLVGRTLPQIQNKLRENMNQAVRNHDSL